MCAVPSCAQPAKTGHLTHTRRAPPLPPLLPELRIVQGDEEQWSLLDGPVVWGR